MNLVASRRCCAAMLSATLLALAAIAGPAVAQTLKDAKCTGHSDIAWTDQITGCSNAIKSGTFAGKNLAAAFTSRATAYVATGDFDRAQADYDRAIKLDPNSAAAFFGRGTASFYKKDYDHAIADYTTAVKLDPNDAFAFNNR